MPPIDRLDHIHIFVTDRPAAEKWYADALGFRRNAKLEKWAVPHGPLMLQDDSGSVMLALFEKSRNENPTIIALGVSGPAFIEWLTHLAGVLNEPLEPVDHGLAWSLYFSDPDGNPFEITTYDYAAVTPLLNADSIR